MNPLSLQTDTTIEFTRTLSFHSEIILYPDKKQFNLQQECRHFRGN